MMKKKLMPLFGLALLLALVFALSVSASAEFTDMPTDATERTALEHAVANGLINGVSATEISPYTALTRAQMAAILTRCFGVTEMADVSAFADVKAGEWYYDSIRKAVAVGILNGDGVGMKPNNSITVEQGLLVLSRIFDLQYTSDTAANGFSDAGSISSWAKDGVNKMVFGGFLTASGNLNPQAPMTRVQFAVLMDRLVAQYIDKAGTYTELPAGNVVIRAEGVTIQGAKTDYDIYVADAVKGTTYIINTAAERVVVRGGAGAVTGTYGWVRAICKNTSLVLDFSKISLKATAKDGKPGKYFADPTKENCFFDLGTISF